MRKRNLTLDHMLDPKLDDQQCQVLSNGFPFVVGR